PHRGVRSSLPPGGQLLNSHPESGLARTVPSGQRVTTAFRSPPAGGAGDQDDLADGFAVLQGPVRGGSVGEREDRANVRDDAALRGGGERALFQLGQSVQYGGTEDLDDGPVRVVVGVLLARRPAVPDEPATRCQPLV